MESTYSYRDLYWSYLTPLQPAGESGVKQQVEQILEQTAWDDPQTSLDWNNLGVIALIEAEKTDDLTLRSMYLEMANDALTQAIESQDHPLAFAHLSILQGLTKAKPVEYLENLFSSFINLLNDAFCATERLALGLVYLPLRNPFLRERVQIQIQNILCSENGYDQTLKLLSEALCQSQLVFYNTFGLRFLNLTIQALSNSPITNLKLGISNLSNNRQEGLLNLYRAQAIDPHLPILRQALYVAYRDLGSHNLAQLWLQPPSPLIQTSELPWRWTELSVDDPLTYVTFEESLILAVEPSFQSIVTKVLIAEGDWFEHEMEFWRYWLKPGMTVIDVGANVGVYTFSAAQRVGPTGRVYAIEPFSQCVQYLETTKRLNQLDWVTICQAAASDHGGQARLSLSSASELNKVLDEDERPTEGMEVVTSVDCLRLDDLISQENLSQVDWLKIDAEGHEMQVLKGSDRLLEELMPGILYENISQGNVNQPVAAYLQSRDYQLFYYQPYVRQLIPIESHEDLPNILNIIALPSRKIENFI